MERTDNPARACNRSQWFPKKIPVREAPGHGRLGHPGAMEPLVMAKGLTVAEGIV
jgi:hypothetical protein